VDVSDADVARLAVRQHGLVTLRQLRGVGVAPGAVRQRIGSGRWHRIDRGVYRIAGAPVTWRSEVLARVLSAGPGAVASHRTAAALWDLDGCRPGAPELTIPQGRRYRRAGVRTHVSTDLHLVTPAVRDGIPTTPVGRTLLDLGAVVDRSRVHLALDDAQRRKLTDWDGVLDTLAAHARRGRDGVATLRSIVDEHDADVAVTDSGFERLVAILLVAAGLPRPVVQHRIVIGGRTIRIDLAYPAARIAIELDGGIHLRRDVWETDRPRQNAVVLEGWTVLRFTWHTYRHHPDRLVSDVRRALRRSGLAA
jgi:very-short-patch-repair endonuclease/predicted transcriptional regulator of viral defense system